jgi:hypothetical protein
LGAILGIEAVEMKSGQNEPKWAKKPGQETQDGEITWKNAGKRAAKIGHTIKVITAWAALLVAMITGGLAFMCLFEPDNWLAGLILGFICLTSASFSSNISASLEEEGRCTNRPDEEQ